MKETSRLYGNCVVLTGDVAMFRCDDERMRWYLENKLAEVLSENPPIIRLTFTPKGPGHAGDPYFLQEFKNRCVVCGVTDGLSHHHIVPYCYRRYFPKESYEKGRWFYDVLLLCVRCHNKYERRANELKTAIAEEHGIPESGVSTLSQDEVRVLKAAAAIFRHGSEMPWLRREQFEQILKVYLGKDVLAPDDAQTVWENLVASVYVTPAGQIIVQKLTDVDAFAVRWRRHFLLHMKPRFLPELWDSERRLYSEPEKRI